MAKVVIKDSHMNYDGVKYFSGGSDEVALGCYGDKKSSLISMNKLQVWDHFPFNKLKINEGSIVDVDLVKSKKADVNQALKGLKVIGGKLSATSGALEEQKIALVKFFVRRGDMEDMINDSDKHRAEFSDRGNDARVTNVIFTIMNWETARKVETSAKLEASVDAGKFAVTVNGKLTSGKDETIKVSEGSTAFYGLLKPKWDKRSKKKRDKVVDLTVDEWGS